MPQGRPDRVDLSSHLVPGVPPPTPFDMAEKAARAGQSSARPVGPREEFRPRPAPSHFSIPVQGNGEVDLDIGEEQLVPIPKPNKNDKYHYDMFSKAGCMTIITAQTKEITFMKRPMAALDYLWVISEGMDQLPNDQQALRTFCGPSWHKEMQRLVQEIPSNQKAKNLWLLRKQFDAGGKQGPCGEIPSGYVIMQVSQTMTPAVFRKYIEEVIKGAQSLGGGVILRCSPPVKIGGIPAQTQREIWSQMIDLT